MNRRVFAISLAARHKGPEGEERRKKQYRELLRLSRQIPNDAKRVLNEVEDLSKNKKRKLHPLTTVLAEMANRVRQVIRQTKARVFKGITQLPGKVVSLFEPHTEIMRTRSSTSGRAIASCRYAPWKNTNGYWGACRGRSPPMQASIRRLKKKQCMRPEGAVPPCSFAELRGRKRHSNMAS